MKYLLLMAAAVLSALAEAASGNSIMHAHLSLARTAELLAIAVVAVCACASPSAQGVR